MSKERDAMMAAKSALRYAEGCELVNSSDIEGDAWGALRALAEGRFDAALELAHFASGIAVWGSRPEHRRTISLPNRIL